MSTPRIFAALLLRAVLIACSLFPHTAASAATPAKLVVSGAETLAPLISDIARRFEATNPGVKVEVRPSGSGKGISDVRAGYADVGMVARALLGNEHDLFAYPVARDGVAVLVHRENPVKGLETRQLADLLTGKLTNWKSVGGRDASIDLALPRGQGSFELILQRLALKRDQVAGRVLDSSLDDTFTFIARNPDAVTLTSIGHSERRIKQGLPIKLLSYNGMPATSRSIQDHGYALSRPLTLITRQLPEGLQKQFIDYALSAEVIDLEIKYGFVPYRD
jgi:phosphate transport system substrate-binding protein